MTKKELLLWINKELTNNTRWKGEFLADCFRSYYKEGLRKIKKIYWKEIK